MNENDISRLVKNVMDNLNAHTPTEENTCTDCKCFKNMTLDVAKKLALKVEAKASEMGVNAVVAVSNTGARPVLVECMDNSYIASYDVALNKAYTVVALKMNTSKLKQLSQPNQPLYGIQFTNNGQIVIFGGGEPLIHKGQIVGGLGVSGGSEEEDTFLASFGAEAFKEIMKEIDK